MSDTNSDTEWPKLHEAATKIVENDGYSTSGIFVVYTPEQRLIAAAVIDIIDNGHPTDALNSINAWIEALALTRKVSR